MQCDALQILQRQDSATQRNFIELRAEETPNSKARTFYAQADSISFDESKELYTLRSKGTAKSPSGGRRHPAAITTEDSPPRACVHPVTAVS